MIRVWWWIERSREWPNGFLMYLVIVYFVKSLNVDHGLVRKHPWIGNSGRGVVQKIHSVIVMCCWWATSLFVKLINHIMFCMYVCSKIYVPLGICWSCVNPSHFTLVLVLCGMLGLSAFCFSCGFWGRRLCWRESFGQSHWKQPKMANGARACEIKVI